MYFTHIPIVKYQLFIKSLLDDKHCAKCFIYTISVNSYNFMRQVLL